MRNLITIYLWLITDVLYISECIHECVLFATIIAKQQNKMLFYTYMYFCYKNTTYNNIIIQFNSIIALSYTFNCPQDHLAITDQINVFHNTITYIFLVHKDYLSQKKTVTVVSL